MKKFRGVVPPSGATLSRLRRLIRAERVGDKDRPKHMVDAINTGQAVACSGRYFHATKGWRKSWRYKHGMLEGFSHLQMADVFVATMKRAGSPVFR